VPPGCGPRWPRPCSWPPCTRPSSWTGRWASPATAGRYADGDLTAILTHQAQATPGPRSQASEGHTLAQGTAGWAGFGEPEVTS
jgi:hypothetical protein